MSYKTLRKDRQKARNYKQYDFTTERTAMSEFNIPNNGYSAEIPDHEFLIMTPEGMTFASISSVIRNPDQSVDVLYSTGNTLHFEAGPSADEVFQLVSDFLSASLPYEPHITIPSLLDDWKFQVKYHIASIDRPDINTVRITFESGKTISFTGYDDLEIGALFHFYLPAEPILFK